MTLRIATATFAAAIALAAPSAQAFGLVGIGITNDHSPIGIGITNDHSPIGIGVTNDHSPMCGWNC